MKFICVKNKKHFKWLIKYLENKNIYYKKIFNFILLKNMDFFVVVDYYNAELLISKTINDSCGFNQKIIKYSDNNKIYNYELGKLLKQVSKEFSVCFVQEYEIYEYSLLIEVKDNKDIIYTMRYHYNDLYDKNKILDIIKGKKIMSIQKENKIIDGVIAKLSCYDIELSNYYYFIKKNFNNSYEVELEHKKTGALILIKSVKIDEDNIISSIGENRGLVL